MKYLIKIQNSKIPFFYRCLEEKRLFDKNKNLDFKRNWWNRRIKIQYWLLFTKTSSLTEVSVIPGICWFVYVIIWFNILGRGLSECTRGLVANVPDLGIIVTKFELSSRNDVHFQTNASEKGISPHVPLTMG